MKDSASKVDKKRNTAQLNVLFDETAELEDTALVIIHWQPLYDLYVSGDEVVVTIEIAGVDVKDFAMYLGREYMIIDGLRKSTDVFTNECCTFHNIEIPYGRFNRRIDFPVPVEPKQYQYTMNHGILTLKLPCVKEKVIPIEDG
jgi:HSP20 family molecular chaperone IbpA